MDRLQIRGICFAIDDFGAGYTALRYLKDFYFDMIKIDGQFIMGIAEDHDNQVVVAAIVSIARHFDMLTVAEFVENQEDAAMLTKLGVDCLQGYHFAAATTTPDWKDDKGLQPAI
jgi:EAL domain-containing protein (putative c-di-GMP-specific phosphodiesterase class I)